MSRIVHFLSALILGLQTASVFAHGEDKPGPNGGFIRMPGAFHTEVVPDPKNNGYFVYLLDVQFKNPVSKTANISVSTQINGKKTPLTCETQENRFFCKNSSKKNNSSDREQLIVKAKYPGFPEGESIYQLPLKLNHSTHH